MNVQCPYCSTRYELPERLIGPGGAEVRCPRCRRRFVVGADGRLFGSGVEPAGEAPGRPAPPAVGAEGPQPPAAATSPPPVAATRAGAPEPAGSRGAPRSGAPAPAGSTRGESPKSIAHAVLDELVARSGEALADAHGRGRLFSEFGPALFGAFDEYRRRAGAKAGPGPFRDALRERWGIELAPRWGEEPPSR